MHTNTHTCIQTYDRYIPLSIISTPHTLGTERINKSIKAYEGAIQNPQGNIINNGIVPRSDKSLSIDDNLKYCDSQTSPSLKLLQTD